MIGMHSRCATVGSRRGPPGAAAPGCLVVPGVRHEHPRGEVRCRDERRGRLSRLQPGLAYGCFLHTRGEATV